MSDEQRQRLVVEFELPTFYCDDVLGALEYIPKEFRADEGAEILAAIGMSSVCALTLQVAGEKCADIVTVPVLARTARIEAEPPTEVDDLEDMAADLVEQDRGPAVEKAGLDGYAEGIADERRALATLLAERGPEAVAARLSSIEQEAGRG